MNYVLDILGCASICIAELTAVIIAGIILQGLVYRTTGISLYNCVKNSIEKEMYPAGKHKHISK